jgi:hypothetical protein
MAAVTAPTLSTNCLRVVMLSGSSSLHTSNPNQAALLRKAVPERI